MSIRLSLMSLLTDFGNLRRVEYGENDDAYKLIETRGLKYATVSLGDRLLLAGDDVIRAESDLRFLLQMYTELVCKHDLDLGGIPYGWTMFRTPIEGLGWIFNQCGIDKYCCWNPFRADSLSDFMSYEYMGLVDVLQANVVISRPVVSNRGDVRLVRSNYVPSAENRIYRVQYIRMRRSKYLKRMLSEVNREFSVYIPALRFIISHPSQCISAESFKRNFMAVDCFQYTLEMILHLESTFNLARELHFC